MLPHYLTVRESLIAFASLTLLKRVVVKSLKGG